DIPMLLGAISDRCQASEDATIPTVFRHIVKGGDIIDVEIQSTAIEFEGRPARLVLANDITHRNKAEKALLASEQRFKALVQDSGDLLLIVSPDGRFQYISPNHHSILGYPKEQMEKSAIYDFIHASDYGTFSEFLESLQSNRRVYSVPYRMRANDGSILWIESIATNALDDAAVNGYVINSRNVTTRIQDQQRIQEVNQRFEAIAKATSDVIYDYDYI